MIDQLQASDFSNDPVQSGDEDTDSSEGRDCDGEINPVDRFLSQLHVIGNFSEMIQER